MLKKFASACCLIIASLLNSAQASQPKVYDCFIFFNELELLELRLNELYDRVDKFVLVEATRTFRGGKKPLYFKEHADRFAKFADKIIYVALDERFNPGTPWENESFQRNQIMRGLANCQDDDIIMISDLDEIIRASSVDTIIQQLTEEKLPYVHCEQDFYRFFLNVRERSPWVGSSATTFNFLKHRSPQFLRESRTSKVPQKDGNLIYPIIKNSGWHFSWTGGIDRLIKKLAAFSHVEFDRPELRNFASLKKFLSQDCYIVEIDESYPLYLRTHLTRFQDAGFIFNGSLWK